MAKMVGFLKLVTIAIKSPKQTSGWVMGGARVVLVRMAVLPEGVGPLFLNLVKVDDEPPFPLEQPAWIGIPCELCKHLEEGSAMTGKGAVVDGAWWGRRFPPWDCPCRRFPPCRRFQEIGSDTQEEEDATATVKPRKHPTSSPLPPKTVVC